MVCGMKKIQRYSQGLYELGADLEEDDEGECVLFEDHEKEVKSLKNLLKVKDAGMKALEEEIEATRKQLKKLEAELNLKGGEG